MQAVATARNTPGTHYNSATGWFSEQACAVVVYANGRHSRYYVTFIIWLLVLAALSLS